MVLLFDNINRIQKRVVRLMKEAAEIENIPSDQVLSNDKVRYEQIHNELRDLRDQLSRYY